MILLGEIYRRMKNYAISQRYLEEGSKRIEKAEDKYGIAKSHYYLGLLSRDMGNIKKAEEYFNRAYQLFSKIGADADASKIQLYIR